MHLSQYVSSSSDVIKFAGSKSALFTAEVTPVLFFFPAMLQDKSSPFVLWVGGMAFSHWFSLQHLRRKVVSVSRKTERSHFCSAFFPEELGHLNTTMSQWNQGGPSWGPWAGILRWQRNPQNLQIQGATSEPGVTQGGSRQTECLTIFGLTTMWHCLPTFCLCDSL